MGLRESLRSFRGPVLLCALLTSMSAAGYGVMFALPDDYRRVHGITASSFGVIIAVGFFSAFVSQLFIAPLADRGHARLMLYSGNLIQIAGFVFMGLSRTAPLLIAARVVTGIGVGMALPAQRRVAILADPDNMGRNVGLMFSFDVGGFALGPAIGAVVGGFFWPFAIVGFILGALLLFVPFIQVTENASDEATRRFAFDLFRNRRFSAGVLYGITLFLMVGTFDALWVLMLDDIGAAEWMKKFGIVAFSVPFILFGAVGGKLSQKVGPFRLAAFGLSVGVIATMMYGRLATPAAMFAVALIHGVNDGFTAASSGIGVGLVVEPERQASAQGMLGGLQAIVGGVAATIAGLLYEHQGRAFAFTAAAAVMVVTIGIATYLAWPLGPIAPPATTGPAPDLRSAAA